MAPEEASPDRRLDDGATHAPSDRPAEPPHRETRIGRYVAEVEGFEPSRELQTPNPLSRRAP